MLWATDKTGKGVEKQGLPAYPVCSALSVVCWLGQWEVRWGDGSMLAASQSRVIDKGGGAIQ